MSRPKLFWFNLCLTIAVVTLLIVTSFPEFYIFAVGLILALVINYPDRKMQNKLVSKYAAATYPIAPIVFMSGVVVGVLEGTGMMEQMVMTLVEIVPSSMGPYLHIIIALLSTPLMFIFTNDTWYFALVPIITAVGEQYGVAADIIVLALFSMLVHLLLSWHSLKSSWPATLEEKQLESIFAFLSSNCGESASFGRW